MVTVFDLFTLIGAMVGAAVGGSYGSSFGWGGTIVGAVIGLAAGVLVGNLPWVASWAWMRYDLGRSSVATLKERVRGEPFVAHLLIGELVSRGEPLEQFREDVAALLRSSDALERQGGEGAAARWFPDLLTAAPPPSGGEPEANDRKA